MNLQKMAQYIKTKRYETKTIQTQPRKDKETKKAQ